MPSATMCRLCLCWHSPHCRAVDPARRWPVEPLVAAAGGVEKVLQQLDGGNLSRARRDGLTDVQADRWATRLGYHPAQVWPDWIDAALRYVDAAAIEGSRAVWLAREAERAA